MMSILKCDSLAARVWFDQLSSNALRKNLPKLKRISLKTLEESRLKNPEKEGFHALIKRQAALGDLIDLKKKISKAKQPARPINHFLRQHTEFEDTVRMTALLNNIK
jgi:hypothetical protein